MAAVQDNENLTDRAYATLKGLLLRLELPPGGTVTEASLAQKLRMSKTPVREALGRLRLEGLVEPTARSGYKVAPITLKDVRDLFEVRVLLEGEAAALAASRMANPEELRRLDEICAASYDPKNPSSVTDYLRTNSDFHVSIARAAGNDYLTQHLAQIVDQMERVLNLSLALAKRPRDSVVHGHSELINAIAARDPDAARRIAVSNLVGAQDWIFEALLASPTIISASILPSQPHETTFLGHPTRPRSQPDAARKALPSRTSSRIKPKD